jgi:probable HAF family extracellular repeat protein
MLDLGELPGGINHSRASRINSYGQVVGESAAATGTRAFLWTPNVPNGVSGAMIDLGDLAGGRDESHAFGINAHGHVVGSSWVANGTHAFLWIPDSPNSTGGTMTDLNTLLSEADRARWLLAEARGINDFGQIVGTGFFDADGPGPMQATPLSFLMTPIPEPSSVVLLCISVVSIRKRAVRPRIGG